MRCRPSPWRIPPIRMQPTKWNPRMRATIGKTTRTTSTTSSTSRRPKPKRSVAAGAWVATRCGALVVVWRTSIVETWATTTAACTPQEIIAQQNFRLGRCGGSGCALIVNPPGHRTINQFHIHFVRYAGYGSNLKGRLERRVCGKSGWRSGGLPCHGKAIFKSGFPGIFSVAMSGGGLRHASVIAWPGSCGGSGTIIELAYGCSIEHQIRGDFNPALR